MEPEVDPFYLGDAAEQALLEERARDYEKAKERAKHTQKFVRTIDAEGQAKKFLATGDPEKTGVDPSGKKRVSHDARAKAHFENAGYTYYKAETYNAFSGRKNDFLGIFDAIAFKPGIGILGIQITTLSNVSARRRKMLASPLLRPWLESGGKAGILAYRQEGNRWVPVWENICLKN